MSILSALQKLEGKLWDRDLEIECQILMIQKRLYGLTNQFFNDEKLTVAQSELLKGGEEISFEQAKTIFFTKEFEDPPMRGRQNLGLLKKLGFIAKVNEKFHITSMGNRAPENGENNFGDVLLKSLLKWQCPNPIDKRNFRAEHGFAIKPFVGTLHLIKGVNEEWQKKGNKPKGISKNEFCLFAPTLINYNSLKHQIRKIIEFREEHRDVLAQNSVSVQEKLKLRYIKKITGEKGEQAKKLLKNLGDYSDNALRYFWMTGFLRIRGKRFYVDLENGRQNEIEILLKNDDASPLYFESESDYQDYIGDVNRPVPPWETEKILRKIAESLMAELGIKSFKIEAKDSKSLKKLISELREKKREAFERNTVEELKSVQNVKACIRQLKDIYKIDKIRKSVELERLAALALNALDDAIRIKPNYPVGDDNEPTFTAPANKADIECFYEKFAAVCEVTMLTTRDQWINEGQPVMRHTRDFEDSQEGKNVYCLFVAPKLHQDTVGTFWIAVKHNYRGQKQKIIPVTIAQVVEILETLLTLKQKNKKFAHGELLRLYEGIVDVNNIDNSDDWIKRIPETIRVWRKGLENGA